jgi:uncharacterized protein (DUF433 family)
LWLRPKEVAISIDPTETVVHTIDLIVSNPKIRGGRPVLAGTSLRVLDIAVQKVFHRQTPDEIAQHFQISLPQVYTALAYYYQHKPEIDADIREQDKIAREYMEKRIGSRHDPILS